MILQIKRGNKVIAESADFSYSPSLQEVRKLTCEVVSVVPIEFKVYNSKSESEYDTVVYNGNTFILYQAPSGDNLNEAGKYKYSLLFYGKEVLLQNVAFLDIVSGTGGEINKIRYTHGGLFQFWGDAKQLAARIEANIESYNASLGAGYTGIGTWTLNVDAEGELTEDMIDITDGTNLFEALKNFYDKFYLNYYFSTTANGGIITITDKTRPSVNWTFKQGDGGGAVKVSSSVDTSTPVITRIIPQGGSRNVPPEYKKDAKPADESRYCPYILLPNDSDGNIRYYIDSEYGLKNYGVRGKTISNTFSGIYPSIRGKKLGDLYPSGLPEWDTYKSDGEPDPQSGKVAGEGASASTRIDKIIGSTPIKSDDSDSFFIYMTSPGFNLGYKVYEDGDSSGKINDNVQPQYKPHAMFDKYRDFERFDIYGTRAYYDQPVKVTATFSGKMLFSILPIGSDAVGKKVKINLRMVLNRVLGQASPLKEVVIGEEGATGMLEIPYDKTSLVGYIEKGQNTTVTIRVEFTFDSDVPAESCKIGFSEEMTCNIHFGNQDGSQDRFYYKYASVTDAVFSMRTGTYTGTEFKINKNGIIPLYGEVNGDTGETEEDVAMFNKGARYKISCYRTDSDNAKLPLYTDGKSPSIAAGTEFVILNIVMPESYVTMAENTLEKAALDYLSRYDHENRTVSLDISSGFVAEHPNLFIDFIEGNMLKVRDDGIGVFDFSDNGQIVDMQLQIQSLEIKYSKENMFPSYSCTIARRKILSFYERLAQENQAASTQNTTNVTLGGSGTGSGTGSGGGSSNITNADHAKSAYTLDENTPVLNWFISALNDDEAQGVINFLKGIKISGHDLKRIVGTKTEYDDIRDDDMLTGLFVIDHFLRKDKPDTANGLITFLKGLLIGKNGSGITVLDNGMSQAVVDYLYVKVKAVFDELEVKKKTYVGGEQVISHAGMKCNRVDELNDVYRCYFKEEEDGIEIENQFTPGSLAIAQECNIKTGVSHHVGNRYYWRLVTAVGENYIDLSKTVCDPNVENDVPVAGDDIVGLGHKTDITRQAAIILSSVNEVSPSIIMYQGINDFTLTGKDVISFDFDKSTGKARMKVYGDTYIGDNDRTTYMEYTQDKGVDIKGMFHIEQGSTGWKNMEGLPDEIQAAADLAQEAKDAIDNASVGSVNLLRNSGFTGDYETEDLSAATELSADTELFSKQLKYWTGVATVSADSDAVSGYSAAIGSLSQSVSLIKGESYVISYKAKGTSVSVSCGSFSVSQPLTSSYQRYTHKITFNGSGIFLISGTATVCDLQLERGTIATDWKPSILDNDKATAGFQSINYIASAIKDGSVDILGGLILANMIQLGNYKDGKMQKVTAGVSGIYNDDDDVAFWAGGKLEQAILTVMRFRNDPNYQPTDAEWANMANFVATHGGDTFLRGYVYALGGKFRGVVEALGGFFRGKVETSVDGKRIVINPDKNTLEMYTAEGHATLILRFDTSSDGWEYGDLILRKYVGDQLIQETTVYPERIRIQNHVENTDIILTPNNVSFYGSKGETLLVGMKPVYDGGAVSKYVANIECSNWPSKDNVSSGQVYVEYETLEGIVTNGVLKVRK